ncbi:uncharacterized protein L201_006310 [Kwoniella dendrophila CBS 6074]|uniref:C3H1-type domain-containing protein n=1 Tax=Kwoniella dendrophila CBS 6074 TaxID=1295534 RepID=A0AAX4K1C7_9TREE
MSALMSPRNYQHVNYSSSHHKNWNERFSSPHSTIDTKYQYIKHPSTGTNSPITDDTSEVDVNLNGFSYFDEPVPTAGYDRYLEKNDNLPNHFAQPPRPRLVGSGVGTVNKYLNDAKAFGSLTTDNNSKASTKHLRVVKEFNAATAASENGQESRTAPSITAKSFTPKSTFQNEKVAHSDYGLFKPTYDGTTTFNPEHMLSSSAYATPSSFLPDLSIFGTAECIASLIAASPNTTMPDGTPVTRPFSFDPLPYTDEDIPVPQPYNIEYPHPITAYASPRVNPETVRRSGYDRLLKHLVREDLPLVLGTRLYDAGFRDLDSSVYLLFSFDGSQGNGIPESLWSKLENVTSSKLPVGTAGISPFARSTTVSMAPQMPPRFAQLSNQTTRDHDTSTSHSNTHDAGYFSRPMFTRQNHYDETPAPSLSYHPIRHASSKHQLSSVAARPTADSHADLIKSINTNRKLDDGCSPFYKTEICSIWSQSGTCKYGNRCQYAHGLEELRLPRHMQDDDRYNGPNLLLHGVEDRMAYPSPGKSTSFQLHPKPTTLPQARPEPRRASCPPQQLATLAETEDDHLLPLSQYQQICEIPAPIGSERPALSSTSIPASTRSSISCTEKWEDMPPFILSDSNHPLANESRSTRLRSEPSTMSLSFSSSSGSRYSMYTDYSDATTSSPIEADITISDQGNLGHPGNGNDQVDIGINRKSGPFSFENGYSVW